MCLENEYKYDRVQQSSKINPDSIPNRQGSTPISSTMKYLLAQLCLSFIVMTQANVIDEDMNVPPLKETFFLFEVISDAPESDLKNCLSGEVVRHSFQVIGENRYLFVMVRDPSKPPSPITFTAGSKVTQYPVEHVHDFFHMEGDDKWIETDVVDRLKNTDNLVVIEYEFHIPPNTKKEEFDSMMVRFAEEYQYVVSQTQIVTYAVVGTIPVKMYFIMNNDDNQMQYEELDGTYVVGGLGNVNARVCHLRII